MFRDIQTTFGAIWHNCFPGCCSACSDLIEADPAPPLRFSPLCGYCSAALRPAAETLNLPGELTLFTAFEDHRVLRSLVKGWKYSGRDAPLPLLITGLADRMRRETLPQPWRLVPVPMPWPRRLLRGFNQSEILARGVARRCDCRVENLLWRKMGAGKQAGRRRGERLLQAKGEYRTRGKVKGGGTVILVDDLCTTGATLRACAGALAGRGIGVRFALTLGAVKMVKPPLVLDSSAEP